MVTKWKNIKYSKFSKAISFILASIFLTGSLTIFIYLACNTNISLEAAYRDNYLKSNSLKNTIIDITIDLKRLVKHYKSEDYIKNGETLERDAYNYYDYSWELENLYSNFRNDYYRNSSENRNTVSKKKLISQFEKEYAEEIETYKNKYINKELDDYYRLIKKIENIDGLYYYMSSAENEYTNSDNKSKSFFKIQPVYIVFDGSSHNKTSLDFNRSDWYCVTDNLSYYPQDTMYVALSDSFITPKIEQWYGDRKFLISNIGYIFLLMVGFMVCLIYLIYTCGKKEKKDQVHLSLIDKVYVDVHIITASIIMCCCFVLAAESFDDVGYLSVIPLSAITSILAINLLLSITKHIRNKTIITYNLTYKIVRKILLFPRKLWRGAPIALRMFPTPNKANDLRNIIEGVEYIKNGELDYAIKTKSKGIYGELGENINSITDGLKAAVNNEIKSQRLKTELISNVSHDIRTPLTSIITYIDLLKKEGLKSSSAEKYLDVLDKKSLRLKTLTDDLFEASKASSGDIPVNLERINIVSLITQGMGELDDKIVYSGLDIKFKYPKEKVLIKADGKLLWRVIENLMSNIFKYALKNSRVYIDVINSENSASIIIKNISAYELNVDAEELMERFKRGDESRNSEGSGLGLSIAKSLVELQNGKFDIEIDGDLFKTTIVMPRFES